MARDAGEEGVEIAARLVRRDGVPRRPVGVVFALLGGPAVARNAERQRPQPRAVFRCALFDRRLIAEKEKVYDLSVVHTAVAPFFFALLLG